MSLKWHPRTDAEDENANQAALLDVRCQSTGWSLASLDVNEIGSYTMYLPGPESEPDTSGVTKRSPGRVLTVDIKLGSREDGCYISIVFRPSRVVDGSAIMSIRNFTDQQFFVAHTKVGGIRGSSSSRELGSSSQHSMSKSTRESIDVANKRKSLVNKLKPRDFDVESIMPVPPETWLPFGFADPTGGSVFRVFRAVDIVGSETAEFDANAESTVVDSLAIGQRFDLQEVFITVHTGKRGRVVILSTADSDLRSGRHVLADPSADASRLQLDFTLPGIALSFVAPLPRREYLHLCLTRVALSVSRQAGREDLSFALGDFQLDSFSEAADFPVLLHSRKTASDKEKTKGKQPGGDLPFAKFQWRKVLPRAGVSPDSESATHYEHISLTLQDIVLGLDTCFIMYALEDIYSHIGTQALSEQNRLAVMNPPLWMQVSTSHLVPHLRSLHFRCFLMIIRS